ncbi:MAG: alpha/beta fold hydrolase [Candidatus Promineifilaceae bacterium]
MENTLERGARPGEMSQGAAANYAEVNGLKLYYQVQGAGRPLILLHGGLGAVEMFAELLPQLAAGRQVIGVDLQAHGHTADVDRPLRFEQMADDIAGLIQHLGLERADLMGFSLGGGVALRTAIQHPELARKLVLISTPFKRKSWYPEMRAGMDQLGPEAAEAMKASPMYHLYASVAPRPEDWPRLVTKVGELIKRDYDWSAEIAAVQAPTLLVVGDADGIRTSHTVQFFELLGGGQADPGWDRAGMPKARLAILPDRTHYDILQSPLLVPAVTSFLDAPLAEDTKSR